MVSDLLDDAEGSTGQEQEHDLKQAAFAVYNGTLNEWFWRHIESKRIAGADSVCHVVSKMVITRGPLFPTQM